MVFHFATQTVIVVFSLSVLKIDREREREREREQKRKLEREKIYQFLDLNIIGRLLSYNFLLLFIKIRYYLEFSTFKSIIHIFRAKA